MLQAQGDSPLSHDQQLRQISAHLVRFVRTPDGEAIASLRDDGTVEIWTMNVSDRKPIRSMILEPEKHKVDHVAVLEGGTCSLSDQGYTACLTLMQGDTLSPTATLRVK